MPQDSRKTPKKNNRQQPEDCGKSYREKRMDDSARNFLNGKARRPYVLREDIVRGLEAHAASSNLSDVGNEDIEATRNENTSHSCSCLETLGQFAFDIKNMLHTGQDLIRRASKTESPNKRYPNVTKQNEWLLNNVFDMYGNYIFCASCVNKILGVHPTRLSRLRKIKREMAKSPTRQIRKKDVPNGRIRDVIPPSDVTNVLEWWLSLEDDSLLEIRDNPKLYHGSSNNSKEHLLPRFLEFIDANSQPNGRQISSHGPLFFISPKFDRINSPSKKEADKPEQWKRRSLVYEFNRTLCEGESISNGTAKKWLKTHRPKHGIAPLLTDYCQMCAECQEQKSRMRAICKRLQLHYNGDEERMRELQNLAESYRLLLEEHQMEANRELHHYRQRTRQSRSSYGEMRGIQCKENQSIEDMRRLEKMENEMTFTLSSDFQQSKLIPHWGNTLQPGETYYLRKLAHNIFAIINHTVAEKTVYVSDERACATKNVDLTISLIDHYIQDKVPDWIRHLCLYMDNGPTNKNQYMIQYGMELVWHNKYDTVEICYLVAGHAKFDPDRLFALIANAFNASDIFSVEQLLKLIRDIINPTGSCIHVTNSDIVTWKELLESKYDPIEKIKSYRNFLIKRDDRGKVKVLKRECCYEGNYTPNKPLLKKGADANLDLRGNLHEFTYKKSGIGTELSEEKMKDLCKMYDSCIAPDLRPDWLPAPRYVEIIPPGSSECPSARLAQQHRNKLKSRKKGDGHNSK